MLKDNASKKQQRCEGVAVSGWLQFILEKSDTIFHETRNIFNLNRFLTWNPLRTAKQGI